MALVKHVTVTYHFEPEGIWADSDDADGFYATAESLGAVRELVHEGLPFYLDCDATDLDIREVKDGLPGLAVVDVHLTGASPVFYAPSRAMTEPRVHKAVPLRIAIG